jgi:hypothetical protein
MAAEPPVPVHDPDLDLHLRDGRRLVPKLVTAIMRVFRSPPRRAGRARSGLSPASGNSGRRDRPATASRSRAETRAFLTMIQLVSASSPRPARRRPTGGRPAGNARDGPPGRLSASPGSIVLAALALLTVAGAGTLPALRRWPDSRRRPSGASADGAAGAEAVVEEARREVRASRGELHGRGGPETRHRRAPASVMLLILALGSMAGPSSRPSLGERFASAWPALSRVWRSGRAAGYPLLATGAVDHLEPLFRPARCAFASRRRAMAADSGTRARLPGPRVESIGRGSSPGRSGRVGSSPRCGATRWGSGRRSAPRLRPGVTCGGVAPTSCWHEPGLSLRRRGAGIGARHTNPARTAAA